MKPGPIGNKASKLMKGTRTLCLCTPVLCSLLFAVTAKASTEPLIITHKLPELNSEERILHEVEVLQLALEKPSPNLALTNCAASPP